MVVWRPWVWQTSCSSNSMTSHSEIPNLQIILMPLQKLQEEKWLEMNFQFKENREKKGVRIWWETGEWNQKLLLLYPGIEFPRVSPIFFPVEFSRDKSPLLEENSAEADTKEGSSRKDQTFLVQVYPVFFSSKVSLLFLFPFSLSLSYRWNFFMGLSLSLSSFFSPCQWRNLFDCTVLGLCFIAFF